MISVTSGKQTQQKCSVSLFTVLFVDFPKNAQIYKAAKPAFGQSTMSLIQTAVQRACICNHSMVFLLLSKF